MTHSPGITAKSDARTQICVLASFFNAGILAAAQAIRDILLSFTTRKKEIFLRKEGNVTKA
jgi:hypothetical protein